jgi:hypothetical protein
MIALTKAYLLDPIADLHWSVFRGAIQDIFSENAEAHPDRLCEHCELLSWIHHFHYVSVGRNAVTA